MAVSKPGLAPVFIGCCFSVPARRFGSVLPWLVQRWLSQVLQLPVRVQPQHRNRLGHFLLPSLFKLQQAAPRPPSVFLWDIQLNGVLQKRYLSLQFT